MKPKLCEVTSCPNYGRYCRLHASFSVKEEKPIAKQSDTMKDAMKVYTKKATAYKRLHPICEAKIEGVCSKVTTDIHHKKGKSSQELLLDEKYWLAVCRKCHQVLEQNPAWAKQNGFSLSRHSKSAA